MTRQAVIALGSNLGDRETTLRNAVQDLDATPGVTVTAVSGLVESNAVKPDGVDESSPAYFNAVALVTSTLEPEQLLDQLNRIENDHGRVRVERWGDRTLDLDLVSFDGLLIDSERLTLPHPRAGERAFVIVPWLQVDPEAMLGGVRIDSLPAARSGEAWPIDAAPLMQGPTDAGSPLMQGVWP